MICSSTATRRNPVIWRTRAGLQDRGHSSRVHLEWKTTIIHSILVWHGLSRNAATVNHAMRSTQGEILCSRARPIVASSLAGRRRKGSIDAAATANVRSHHGGAQGRAGAKSPKHQAVRSPVSFTDLCPGCAMSKLTVWRVVSAACRRLTTTQALPHHSTIVSLTLLVGSRRPM